MTIQIINFYEWEKLHREDLLTLYREYVSSMINSRTNIITMEDYDTWTKEEYDQKIRNKEIEESIDNYKSFPISSFCREDLIDIGFDVSKVSNDDMKELADKLSDAYCESDFWIELPIIANNMNIPKLKNLKT
jgi:hypothetical protein